MFRQSLDLSAASDRSGWIRIGRGNLRKIAIILIAASAVIAAFITAPMSEFGPILFGRTLPLAISYVASVVVVFSLFAPIMLPRATRSLYVDAARSRVRVGLRSMPIDQLRHAYRLPDPVADGRFQLRLAVRGLDALVGISAKAPAEMATSELDALLAVIERAPIEPDPAVSLRPPLGDELGVRSAAERFDDELTLILLPYELTSFAKPTLLRELRAVRDALGNVGAGAGASLVRDIGLVAPGTTNAPERLAALAQEEAQQPQGKPRGFWALQGARYRTALAQTESWLQSTSKGSFTPRLGWEWPVGLIIVIGGVLSPWLSGLVVVANILLFFNPDFAAYTGPIAFFILSWPFIVWAGLMLMWRGRIARYERARKAALEVRRGGIEVQSSVADFFGPPFPEAAMLNANIWHLLSQFIVLLAGGLTAFAIANSLAGVWDSFPIGIPVGILMVLSSAVVFTAAVRYIGTGGVRQLRARAVWEAISSRPEATRE